MKMNMTRAKAIALLLFVSTSIGLMLLMTNADYYLGDTVVIAGIAWNWSTLATVMMTVAVFPFMYLILDRQLKRMKRKK